MARERAVQWFKKHKEQAERNDEAASKPSHASSVQTLIFDKRHFTADQAKAWAKKNNFSAGSVDETSDSIRLRQKDPSKFRKGSFRTIKLRQGIKAVIGRASESSDSKKEQSILAACFAGDLTPITEQVETERFSEDLKLIEDETVTEFMEELGEAIADQIRTPCGSYAYCTCVSSDWFVYYVSTPCGCCIPCDCCADDVEACDPTSACAKQTGEYRYCRDRDNDFFQIPYTRDDKGAFTFGAPQQVEPRTVYEPIADDDDGDDDADTVTVNAEGKVKVKSAETMTTGDVATATGSTGGKKKTIKLGPKAVKGGTGGGDTVTESTESVQVPLEVFTEYTAANPLRDVFRLEDVSMDTETGMTDAINDRKAAPNGKKFLASMEGYVLELGKVGRNRRLYHPSNADENVKRMSEQIDRAYQKTESGANHDLIPGHTGHPENGKDFMAMSSMLIGIKREGNRIKVRKGILDMANGAGQTLLDAQSYGFPLGESGQFRGRGKKIKLTKDSEWYAGNEAYEGQEIEIVDPWISDLYDTVADPSFMVWLGENTSMPAVLREQVIALCKDGSAPVNGSCACERPISEAQGADTMALDKNFKEAVAKLSADELRAEAPALVESILSAEKAKWEESVKAKTAADADALKKLQESFDTQGKALTEATARIVKIEEAKQKAEIDAAVLKAIESLCNGKEHGDNLRNFLTEEVLTEGRVTDPSKLDETVKRYAEKWGRLVEPSLKASKGVNERERDASATEQRNESVINGAFPLLGFAPDKPKTEGVAQ